MFALSEEWLSSRNIALVFTAFILLFLLQIAVLHVGDVLSSRKARHWSSRTFTQIVQEIFPETISCIVGFFWWALTWPTPTLLIGVARALVGWCHRAVWYYEGDAVQGYCALTIDDAPGRGEPLTEEVLALLEEFEAKCTFFVVSRYMDPHMNFLHDCVSHGHELANHGGDDIPYHRYSKSEFREVLVDCQAKIDMVNQAVLPSSQVSSSIKWFRPPQGKMSAAMDALLTEHDYRVAMCDCWAMDVVCGADFVQKYTLQHAKSGSIVLVHMPEQDFRDWTLVALRGILAGLKQRNIKCVTLSRLHQLASGQS